MNFFNCQMVPLVYMELRNQTFDNADGLFKLGTGSCYKII